MPFQSTVRLLGGYNEGVRVPANHPIGGVVGQDGDLSPVPEGVNDSPPGRIPNSDGGDFSQGDNNGLRKLGNAVCQHC